MTAADLLADLAVQGFTLAAEGAGIRVRPLSRLTPEQRAAVQNHKPALLELLRNRESSLAALPVAPVPAPQRLPTGRVMITMASGQVESCDGEAMPPSAILWCRPGDKEWTRIAAQ